jgi:hyperosmotically inducible protein
MRALRKYPVGVACLVTLLSIGCRRGGADGSLSGSGGTPGAAVTDDLKGVAKQTEKTAKDIGHATAQLADKAGADGQDAWITTKVKSALTGQGVDPLHVHVDTSGKVVTLSGTVPSAAERDKAVNAARTVTEVVEVKDHLFVQPNGR